MSIDLATVDELSRKLDGVDYLADQGLATALFCAARLPQPLLLEGEAGVGKTEAAKALAATLDTPLVRLQGRSASHPFPVPRGPKAPSRSLACTSEVCF